MRPSRSAASIIASAMRSLSEPPGVELLALAEHVGHRRVDEMTQPHDGGSPDELQHVVDGECGHWRGFLEEGQQLTTFD